MSLCLKILLKAVILKVSTSPVCTLRAAVQKQNIWKHIWYGNSGFSDPQTGLELYKVHHKHLGRALNILFVKALINSKINHWIDALNIVH